MSWKSVEMQVALPRVQDAGKLQEQIAQRNPTLQHFVSQKQEQLDRKKRVSVMNSENVEDALVNDEGPSQTPSLSEKGANVKEETIDHPFLGKRVDYSG
ncbi:hypothetical protein H0266_04125 [Halobacillus locisalis]|uniref:Uncharacterized protein n=1 Tax=Halobacillus locisalis TaxID=220753 RepID=A0A838CQ49_9BACI|nr:hypothetical protein [Halobacillus locisalis]MBA2174084.1 hypothetical protein [Halobacillus locisalis]